MMMQAIDRQGPAVFNCFCAFCTTFHLLVGLPFGPLPWMDILDGCADILSCATTMLLVGTVIVASVAWVVMPIVICTLFLWIAIEIHTIRRSLQRFQRRARVAARAA